MQTASYLAGHVMRIEVEGADMLADLLEWRKVFRG